MKTVQDYIYEVYWWAGRHGYDIKHEEVKRIAGLLYFKKADSNGIEIYCLEKFGTEIAKLKQEIISIKALLEETLDINASMQFTERLNLYTDKYLDLCIKQAQAITSESRDFVKSIKQ